MNNFILLLLNGLSVMNVTVDANERLSFFGRLYNMDTNPDVGIWYLIITLFVLMIIVYHLGFARKLKVWQHAVIYIVTFIGTLFLSFLGVFYPVGESLIIAAIILGIYRFRLHSERESGALSLEEKRRQAKEQSKLVAKKVNEERK